MDKLDVSRSLVSTGDGSNTLYHPGVGEHYHSRHGALAESKHVFIEMGLKALLERDAANTPQHEEPLRVVEIGFGTGLNYLLSAAEAAEAAEASEASAPSAITEQGRALDYVGIEAFPLPIETIQSLGYEQFVPGNLWQAFIGLYTQAIWEASTYCEKGGVNVLANSQLSIVHSLVQEVQLPEAHFDLVYFDAFAAIHQPEMWSHEVFEQVSKWVRPGGILVTYAITGQLKRTLKALGWSIEKLPGAPGKREMLRAQKL